MHRRTTRRGKRKAEILEALDHGVGGTLAFEQFEDGANRALHLAVRIEHNLVVVEDKPDRQTGSAARLWTPC